jgi:hypothetical protein
MSLKSRREDRARKRNQEIADLRTLQQTSLQQIDAQFAEVDKITNPVRKISKLEAVQSSISAANKKVSSFLEKIENRRAGPKVAAVLGIAAAIAIGTVVAASVIFSPLLLVYLLTVPVTTLVLGGLPASMALSAEQKKLKKQTAGFGNFAEMTKTRLANASKMLDETMDTCTYDEVASSFSNDPSALKKFVDSHERLSVRFGDASKNDNAQNTVSVASQKRPAQRTRPVVSN